MNELNDAVIRSFLSDISNFHLVIFGIATTLFTVIYSFILNRHSELKDVSEKIKKEGRGTSLLCKESLYIGYIKRLKRVNWWVLLVSLISFLSSITSWIVANMVNNENVRYISFWIISVVTVILMVLFIILAVVILIGYGKSTKI
ncbi:MAG: hypothetical protein LBM62_05285 [Mediterranea sp.]|jgi:glucose-6-phosphate-specific signal transduction histidine kinase|nr:hypothetical protein [Mediterranea sp.]